jgi:hypothetical protein
LAGGKFDEETDGCLDWLKVLLDKNSLEDAKKSTVYAYDNYFKLFRPHLINHNSLGNLIDFNRLENTKCLPFEISLRLCAIRETFEETGLLLARKKSSNDEKLSHESTIMSSLCINKDESVTREWLKRIQYDSREFLNMCLELNLIPDIWSLHEWVRKD